MKCISSNVTSVKSRDKMYIMINDCGENEIRIYAVTT